MPYWGIVLFIVYLVGVIVHVLLLKLLLSTNLKEREMLFKKRGRFYVYRWVFLSWLGIILKFRLRVGKD